MVNSEATFTYPPSMCFFAGGDSLVIPAGVQKFIERKKSTLKTRIDEIASKAIRNLRIGDLSLGCDAAITEQTFKRSCYRRPDKDYLAEMYGPGVLYSLYMRSCGSSLIKYDSHRGL